MGKEAQPFCKCTAQALLPPPPALRLPSPPWSKVWSMSGRRCSRGLLGAPAALHLSAPCSAGRTGLSDRPTLWYAPLSTPCCLAILQQHQPRTRTSARTHTHTHTSISHYICQTSLPLDMSRESPNRPSLSRYGIHAHTHTHTHTQWEVWHGYGSPHSFWQKPK